MVIFYVMQKFLDPIFAPGLAYIGDMLRNVDDIVAFSGQPVVGRPGVHPFMEFLKGLSRSPFA